MTYNEYLYEMDCLGESICNDLVDATIMNEGVGAAWNKFVEFMKNIFKKIKNFFINIAKSISDWVLQKGEVTQDVKMNKAILKSPKSLNVSKINKLLSGKGKEKEFSEMNELIKSRVEELDNAGEIVLRKGPLNGSVINAIKAWGTLARDLADAIPNSFSLTEGRRPSESTADWNREIIGGHKAGDVERIKKDKASDADSKAFINRLRQLVDQSGYAGEEEVNKAEASGKRAGKKVMNDPKWAAQTVEGHAAAKYGADIAPKMKELAQTILQYAVRLRNEAGVFSSSKTDAAGSIITRKRVVMANKKNAINKKIKALRVEYRKTNDADEKRAIAAEIAKLKDAVAGIDNQEATTESAADLRYLRAQLLIEAADAIAEADDAGEPLPTVDEYDPEEGFVINEPEAEESEEYVPEVSGGDSDDDISEDDEYTEEIEDLLEDDDDALDILTDDEGSEIIDAEPTLESILGLDL